MLSIDQLSRTEKLRMMEALWDDLSRDEAGLESPAWHADALRAAESALEAGEAEFIDWERARKMLLLERAA